MVGKLPRKPTGSASVMRKVETPIIAQGVFCNHAVRAAAEQETNRRGVGGIAQEVVDRGEVEIQLAGELWPELAHFQINDDIAVQLDVVEEEIQIEILLTNLKMILAAEKGEANAKFEHECLQVLEQTAFEIAFDRVIVEGQEVEVVRIFEQILDKIGLRTGERAHKVGRRLTLAEMKRRIDLERQDISAPAVFDSGTSVPAANLWIIELVEDDAIVEPRDLCSNLLHKCLVWPGLGEGAHVLEITCREPLHFREFASQVA